jgi:DNA-directed RNA polymerase I and III subunit RPAC1
MEDPIIEDLNMYDFKINIDCSLANAIRRTIISKIPSIVICNVCIKENDSILDDEIIAHRLGQIPLRKIEDTAETEYDINLDFTGPMTIYSRDIAFSKGIKVVDPDIIIVKLRKGEQIKLFGTTEEGTGEEHAKFSVSCGTSYKKLGPGEYHFHIETTGSFTAKEAFRKSLGILREDLLVYKK